MRAAKSAYIFDFDCTITRRHTGGLAVSRAELSPEAIFSNVKKGFREAVESFIRLGSSVYIASFADDFYSRGNPEYVAGSALIKCYMDEIFGPNQSYFRLPERNEYGDVIKYHNIIAKDSRDFKEYHLRTIAAYENIEFGNPEEMGRLVLIDDEPANVSYAFKKGCSLLIPTAYKESAKLARQENLFDFMLAHHLGKAQV